MHFDLSAVVSQERSLRGAGQMAKRWYQSSVIHWVVLVALLLICSGSALAQDSANITGQVLDTTGAAVQGATLTARNADTGLVRSTTSDEQGLYRMYALPLGPYEVRASKSGFQEVLRTGVKLVVGEEAKVDLTLRVGAVSEKVQIVEPAPQVSTTTTDISGLVDEQQVKDLPLNGRSFDLLLPLNPGVVNFTSEKTGGTGVSNSTNGNNFAVDGNRPQQNLFLLNGIEYTGAAENNMQPGGTSGQLLGVEAVQEFNVLRDSYGSEYGKHPGAQVLIVSQSGTNNWHGSAYEFLRNNDLDSRNFFDIHGAPPFQRNQFGAALGGPIQKDKTFFFLNYEGFRQNLHQTSLTFVPANDARTNPGLGVTWGSACPAAEQVACAKVVQQLLTLWPLANGPELTTNGLPEWTVKRNCQTLREPGAAHPGGFRVGEGGPCLFRARHPGARTTRSTTGTTTRRRCSTPTAQTWRICARRC